MRTSTPLTSLTSHQRASSPGRRLSPRAAADSLLRRAVGEPLASDSRGRGNTSRDPLFWRRLFARDGTGGGRIRRGQRGGIRENLNHGIVNKYKKSNHVIQDMIRLVV